MWWLLGAPALVAIVGLGCAGLIITFTPDPARDAATLTRAATISAAGLAGAPALALLGAGLPEEVLFRSLGILAPLDWIASRRGGEPTRRAAVVLAVISTALFAGAHAPYGVRNTVVAAVLGAGYSALAVASRSVLPAIAAHALYDTATFTLPLLLAR